MIVENSVTQILPPRDLTRVHIFGVSCERTFGGIFVGSSKEEEFSRKKTSVMIDECVRFPGSTNKTREGKPCLMIA